MRQTFAALFRKNELFFEASNVASVAQIDAVKNLRIFQTIVINLLRRRIGEFQWAIKKLLQIEIAEAEQLVAQLRG